MLHDEHASGQTRQSSSSHPISRRKAIQGTVAGVGALTVGTLNWFSATSPVSAATSYNYAFATFLGDAASQEKLSVYTASDGVNFSLLSNTGYTGPTGVLRDPSIMLHIDGKYYIAYTTQSWTTASNNFAIASSSDLLNWTYLTSITSTIAKTHFVWAPEWFKDSDGTINVLVTIDDSGNGSNFRIFKYTATNSRLTSWSGPTLVIGSGNYIDPFIVKLGATYHLFAKGPTYIETATATSLTGPWTWVGTGDWAGWGNDKEGPALFQLDNGSWRALMDYDLGGNKQFVYSDSANGLKTWTAPQRFPGISGVVRHGTILKNYYKIISRNSGKVLDVANASTADGGSVEQWSDNGGTNQQWRLVSVSGGYYKIVSRSSGKVLDVTNASKADGGSVEQWSDNGGTNQQWSLVPTGNYYKIVNRNSGKVLDVTNASKADGGSVEQWSDNGGTNQQWSII